MNTWRSGKDSGPLPSKKASYLAVALFVFTFKGCPTTLGKASIDVWELALESGMILFISFPILDSEGVFILFIRFPSEAVCGSLFLWATR